MRHRELYSSSDGLNPPRQYAMLGLAHGVHASLVTMAALAAIALPLGCGRAPSTDANNPPAVATVDPESERTADEQASSQPVEEEAIAATAASAEVPPQHAAPDEPTASEPSPATASERILLFTPGGPLVCEFLVEFGGQGQENELERLVDEALAAAHAAAEGEPTWNSLVESRGFRSGRFGNAPWKTPDERRQTITRFDWNRNRRVDRDEMRRLITRNNRSSGTIAWHAQETLNQSQSEPLWQTVDADHDQVLSPEEIRTATERLRSRDASDDELLTSADLVAAAPSQMNDEQRPRVSAQPALAHPLSTDSNWEQLWRALREAYPDLSAPTTAGGHRAARLLEALDTNSSGSVSRDELAEMLVRRPDLRVMVHWHSSAHTASAEESDVKGTPDIETPVIGVETPADGEWHVCAPEGMRNRLIVDGPEISLELSAVDAAPRSADPDQIAKQQMSQFDRDGNGYLDEAEVAPAEQALAAFDALDENGDDKVYADELATFQRRRSIVSHARMDAYIGRQADPLFAALDLDHNERLGARELSGAPHRLAALDLNTDGKLTSDELPDRLTLEIARGAMRSDDMAPSRTTRQPRPAVRRGPNWFQQMDTNGDGDVSSSEFLGSHARFAELDRDSDGFIDANEAEQAASK